MSMMFACWPHSEAQSSQCVNFGLRSVAELSNVLCSYREGTNPNAEVYNMQSLSASKKQ